MNHFRIESPYRIYLVIALLAGVVVSPLPYSAASLALLGLHLYFIFRPPQAVWSLSAIILTFVLLPLILEPVAGGIGAVVLAVPALPLLDSSLRRYARAKFSLPDDKQTVKIREILSTLSLLLLLSAVVLTNLTLALTSAVLGGYLLGILGYIHYAIPSKPLEESQTSSRVMAGKKVVATVTLKNKGKMPLYLWLSSPYPWLRLSPAQATLEGEGKVDLEGYPPLTGPSRLQISALIIDPWDFIQREQTLEPVELLVIPRVRYARWLAEKYLEQATPGTAATTVSLPFHNSSLRAGKGVEYFASRPYQPGDRWKDIDWKHSFLFRELITKEHIEGQGQAVIMLVNLTTKDEEEKDRLACQMIEISLTLAREAVPVALAAYNHQEMITTTPLLNSHEVVKRALKLCEHIVIHPSGEKFLQPGSLGRLKRIINQLEEAKIEPAQRLRDLLWLEYQSVQEMARSHPVGTALKEIADHIAPPALLVVISSRNHDVEALLVALEKLGPLGYRTIPVEVKRNHI